MDLSLMRLKCFCVKKTLQEGMNTFKGIESCHLSSTETAVIYSLLNTAMVPKLKYA